MASSTAPIPNPLLKAEDDLTMNSIETTNIAPPQAENILMKTEDQNGITTTTSSTTTNGNVNPVTIASTSTSTSNNNNNPNNQTALNLFAPAQGDFNDSGAYDIDINELFHDCYFEEYNPTLEEDHRIPSLPPPNNSSSSENNKAISVVDSGVLPDIVASNLNNASNNILPQKRSSPSADELPPFNTINIVQPQPIISQPTPNPMLSVQQQFQQAQVIPQAATTQYQFQQPVVPHATSSFSSATSTAKLTEQQKLERRERNREHAKRSRLRKKFLLESLQEQIHGLQSDIEKLTSAVRKELPSKAEELLRDMQLSTDVSISGTASGNGNCGPNGTQYKPVNMPSGFGPVKTLIEPDFRLMFSLSNSQQNFAISDPSLPDNPIIYVSQGFLDLTGYTLDQVLGRNCRFLQGPGTDQAAVEVIRKGMKEGVDTSVCLLNYKADGTPFWNQFFVAALKDANNNIVNYVGVQCEVSKAVVESHLDHLTKDDNLATVTADTTTDTTTTSVCATAGTTTG